MIAIINIGGDLEGLSKYRLQINKDIICEFWHNRPDGLAECLRRAADAVEKTREKEAERILKLVRRDGE